MNFKDSLGDWVALASVLSPILVAVVIWLAVLGVVLSAIAATLLPDVRDWWYLILSNL